MNRHHRQGSTVAVSLADMSVYEKGLITILGCDLLLALIAIPLMLRRVRRNVVYGFRTRFTLSDDAVWYEATPISVGGCSSQVWSALPRS